MEENFAQDSKYMRSELAMLASLTEFAILLEGMKFYTI